MSRTDRLGLAGKCLSKFEEEQARFRYVLQKIYNEKLRRKKLDVLNDNFNPKIRCINAKNRKEIGKNKQVNQSR